MKVIAADEEEEDGEEDEEPRAAPGVLHQQLAEDPVGAGEATGNTYECSIEKSSLQNVLKIRVEFPLNKVSSLKPNDCKV